MTNNPNLVEARKLITIADMINELLDARSIVREEKGENSRSFAIIRKLISVLARMDDNEIRVIIKRKAKPL